MSTDQWDHADDSSHEDVDAVAETFTGNLRNLIRTSSRNLAGSVLILYFLAVVRDPTLFNTFQEWLVGAFSVACLFGCFYSVYKYLEWYETYDAQTLGVEDVGHLRAAMDAVNEEGKSAQKRRNLAIPQFGLADHEAEQDDSSSSGEGGYYD